MLSEYIDSSYKSSVWRFNLKTDELTTLFLEKAKKTRLMHLKGHELAGGGGSEQL